MKSLPNIEKSGFHRGEYVGYAQGVYRITRTNSSFGNWLAAPVPAYNSAGELRPTHYACTLAGMSQKLIKWEAIRAAAIAQEAADA